AERAERGRLAARRWVVLVTERFCLRLCGVGVVVLEPFAARRRTATSRTGRSGAPSRGRRGIERLHAEIVAGPPDAGEIRMSIRCAGRGFLCGGERGCEEDGTGDV